MVERARRVMARIFLLFLPWEGFLIESINCAIFRPNTQRPRGNKCEKEGKVEERQMRSMNKPDSKNDVSIIVLQCEIGPHFVSLMTHVHYPVLQKWVKWIIFL